VWEAVQRHKAHLEATGELAERRARRVVDELRSIVARRLEERARSLLGREGLERLEGDVVERQLDPWAAADEVLGALDEQ
jgi:LAO/AO transport system kinase